MSNDHTNDPDWLNTQIESYLNLERPIYVAFAQLMESILQQVKREVAPLAFVGCRVKKPDSFAEKILRKRHAYKDPVNDMTDLCGARIVVPTLDAIEPVCARIRQLLVVEDEDMEDKRSLHRVSEFGYLSIHYLVQVDPELLPNTLPDQAREWAAQINGPDNSGQPRRRKAELQIRTLLQHAWSDVSHDRIYKTQVRIPDEYQREAGRLAAMLETADQRFAEFAARIDAYSQRYHAYLEPGEIDAEISRLECIRDNPHIQGEDELKLTLRTAKLARAVGDWERVIYLCRPYSSANTEAAFLCGEAMCISTCDTPDAPEFIEGLRLLETVCLLPLEGHFRAEALARLAWALFRASKTDARELKDLRYEAWIASPENPYHFKEFLEAALLADKSTAPAKLLEVQIARAIKTCREHIDAGIELPQAWFALGQLQVLSSRGNQALESYIEGLSLQCADAQVIDEWESLKALDSCLENPPEGLRIVSLLMALAALVRRTRGQSADAAKSIAQSMGLRAGSVSFQQPIIIFAGHGTDDHAVPNEEPFLRTALSGLSGTLLSGGTDSGLPGIIDRIAQLNPDTATCVGYLPEQIPEDAHIGNGYHTLVRTPQATDFSVEDPIWMWVDLVSSGIDPSTTRLLGINGGQIARFEYKLALALGATVGLVAGSGRSADEVLSEGPRDRLIALPQDAASWWCFFRVHHPQADLSSFEPIARAVHEAYRKAKHQSLIQSIAVDDWDGLSDDFKRSNLHQASFLQAILQASGFTLVDAGSPQPAAVFTHEEIDQMAEMEHGRWCVERLLHGWRFGPRDNQNKLHDNLVPWGLLPSSIKEYDINTVRNWPQFIASTGKKIIRK